MQNYSYLTTSSMLNGKHLLIVKIKKNAASIENEQKYAQCSMLNAHAIKVSDSNITIDMKLFQ